jgi:hypothetical protein
LAGQARGEVNVPNKSENHEGEEIPVDRIGDADPTGDETPVHSEPEPSLRPVGPAFHERVTGVNTCQRLDLPTELLRTEHERERFR